MRTPDDEMVGNQAIEGRIRAFMIEHFPLARKSGLKNASENWLESGMVDSLGILDLVHFLEEAFGVVVADEELLPENFATLMAVSAFVRSKKGPVVAEKAGS